MRTFRLWVVGLVLLSTACKTTTEYVYVDPPAIPELRQTSDEACPGLEPIADRSREAMARALAGAVGKYLPCQANNAEVTNSYNAVRTAREDYMRTAREQREAREKQTSKAK